LLVAALLVGLSVSPPVPKPEFACGARVMQQREVMREALADVAKRGLRGKHHYSITFQTTSTGVALPAQLMAQYPETMTIILQHQFERLKVTEERFEVTLWFKGVKTRVAVPFDAITLFIDPSANMWLETDAAARGQRCRQPWRQWNLGAENDVDAFAITST
jgi:hypothetical protein